MIRCGLIFWMMVLSSVSAAEGITAPTFENISQTATAQSYYSQVKIEVRPLGLKESLAGFNVFLDGKLLGVSPATISKRVSYAQRYDLSVEKDGYQEAFRHGIFLPPDGLIDISVLKTNPAQFYTRPSFIVGLALAAGSLVAYAQPDDQSAGLGMLLGGIGIIAVSQGIARWIHLPSLKRKLLHYNQRHQP